MVMTFDETKELEELKQTHKLALIEAEAKDRKVEHDEKNARLDKLLEIAKAGGAKLDSE